MSDQFAPYSSGYAAVSNTASAGPRAYGPVQSEVYVRRYLTLSSVSAAVFRPATFPTPATSNATCGFPALRLPGNFLSRWETRRKRAFAYFFSLSPCPRFFEGFESVNQTHAPNRPFPIWAYGLLRFTHHAYSALSFAHVVANLPPASTAAEVT